MSKKRWLERCRSWIFDEILKPEQEMAIYSLLHWRDGSIFVAASPLSSAPIKTAMLRRLSKYALKGFWGKMSREIKLKPRTKLIHNICKEFSSKNMCGTFLSRDTLVVCVSGGLIIISEWGSTVVTLQYCNVIYPVDLFSVTWGVYHQCMYWILLVFKTQPQQARLKVHCLKTFAITMCTRGSKNSSIAQSSLLRWNDIHRFEHVAVCWCWHRLHLF